MLIRMEETSQLPKKKWKLLGSESFLVYSEKVFLGISFVMVINKSSTIAEYWRVDNLIGNYGIQNTMIRNRFCEILQNLHFADNRKYNKTDKVFTMRPVIYYLHSKSSKVLSSKGAQRIDRQVMKFKDRFGIKQYIKSKPIKWGFKSWFYFSSKSGYLYQMDIYLGRQQTPEFSLGLGEEVVLQLTKDLEQWFCTVYFDNFLNSPKLIEKLFQKGIYSVGTVRANRKQMVNMINDKQTKRGDCEFPFSGNTMACKRMDTRSVLLLSYAFEGMNDILSVQRRQKRLKLRTQPLNPFLSSELIICHSFLPFIHSSVPCPKVVKLYNSGMGEIDLMDQRTAAYRLDRKSSVRFYLRILFDLMGIACVNYYLIYNMKHPNKLTIKTT